MFNQNHIYTTIIAEALLKSRTEGGGILEKHDISKRITEVSKSILSYCIARTANQYEANDLAQDIILELLKSSHNIRDDDAFYGFMWSVAGNVYKQWCRNKGKMHECELTDNILDEKDELTDIIDDSSDIYLLRRELALLMAKYRHATIMYYIDNKSCSEISRSLSISESMVKYLLFKSRKILKEGMNMERKYGEQSYNPKCLNLMYMGEGPNKHWQLINGNKIRQNILWACYNESLTEEAIALQIGVSLPYIEDDIKTLTDTWLLEKKGNYYRTNIIILTEEFENEKATKLFPIQKEIADKLKYFIEANETAIRKIGFQGNDITLNSLKWHMVTMMLFNAYSTVGDGLFSDESRPLTSFGEHAYIWGTEIVKGGFNCCTIQSQEWNTSIDLFFMDWSGRPNIHHNDFYSNIKWVKLYDKIAHGHAGELNEFEKEIAAEMIKKGYLVLEDNSFHITMPVYTSEQLDTMVLLQKQTVIEIGVLYQNLQKTIAKILKNHAPTHLKSQVNNIAAMSLFNDGAYVPASILNQNGYLSTEWTPKEIATSYVVVK